MLTTTKTSAGGSVQWVIPTRTVLPDPLPAPCPCPLCRHSRAMQAMRSALADIDVATDAWVEMGGNTECDLSYLRDEVAAAIAGPLSQVKRRLREALRVTGKRVAA